MIDSMIVQLLDLAEAFMKEIYDLSTTLIWWFVTPLVKIIEYYDPTNISAILRIPVFYFIKDYSILQITLGAGIGFYLLYQFLTWLFDLFS